MALIGHSRGAACAWELDTNANVSRIILLGTDTNIQNHVKTHIINGAFDIFAFRGRSKESTPHQTLLPYEGHLSILYSPAAHAAICRALALP